MDEPSGAQVEGFAKRVDWYRGEGLDLGHTFDNDDLEALIALWQDDQVVILPREAAITLALESTLCYVNGTDLAQAEIGAMQVNVLIVSKEDLAVLGDDWWPAVEKILQLRQTHGERLRRYVDETRGPLITYLQRVLQESRA